MMVKDEKYTQHCIFSELDCYIEFYKDISMSVFSFCSMGTTAIVNIDTYVYSSIQGTLESIRTILITGRINDAYALLRKYHDSAIINIYSDLYLQDHFSLQNFIVEKINNWLHGKEKLPEYRVMSDYIRKSDKLAVINEILFRQDDRYKIIRDRCNDHTHYNFFNNILINDNEIYLKNRLHSLNDFSKDVRNLFILHLAYMFYLNNHYMASSDYIDCLECGVTPEEGSQYWVATFIQEIFDEVITKERPDITAAIKQSTEMQLA